MNPLPRITFNTTERPGLLAQYSPKVGTFDEMVDAKGTIRPHWLLLAESLQAMGPVKLEERRKTIARLLGDHGVTYNLFQDTVDAGRPWDLDALPAVISAHDFAFVNRALQQRFRLFNAILLDVYGPQRLITEGWIPPRLLHANPGYLRAVRGIIPRALPLHGVGTDLIRSPSGTWHVLGDRTQMPFGAGYALENRIILAQAFSREFRDSRIQRLAQFFEAEREGFRACADARRGLPNVVMVTPGPQHPGYFENAFKAKYLGIPLVEGADLTVRDRRLYLKTLEGLLRVDVLVRRVDDHACDSLELDPKSWCGIPGLVEAWRAGNVGIVNGLGSGLLEAQAWIPFLPQLCRKYLSEDLLMTSLPTWWCGQNREREMVLADPSKWVFKRAFYDGVSEPLQGAAMDATGRAKLCERIRREPELWVAQQFCELSTVPVFQDGNLSSRSFVWRAYTIQDKEAPKVMPGGLGRVSRDPGGFLVTIKTGAISKDVWVLSESEVDNRSLLEQRVETIRPARPPSEVPSRMADHLFWLGRYAERYEQVARTLRACWNRLTGEGGEAQVLEAELCFRLLQKLEILSNSSEIFSIPDFIVELLELMQERKKEGGLINFLERLRMNAASARDRLSDDTWRLFNRWQDDTIKARQIQSATDAISFLDGLILDTAAFSGMQLENMTRGHGWRFLEMGRRIERSLALLSNAIAAFTISETHPEILSPLLEIFDSSMTYRRLHYARPKILPVLDLLILNESNPRSLAFQMAAIGRQVIQLPQGPLLGGSGRIKEQSDAIRSSLDSLNLQDLTAKQGNSPSLFPAVCQKMLEQIESFSNSVTEEYFSHAMRRAR